MIRVKLFAVSRIQHRTSTTRHVSTRSNISSIHGSNGIISSPRRLKKMLNNNGSSSKKYHTSRIVQAEEKAETNSTSTATSSENVRTAMRQFLFRVHPDFFAKFPSVQQTNERALKQTNQLLDILEDYNSRDGPVILDSNKVPRKLTVSFFLRDIKSPQSDTAEGEASQIIATDSKRRSKKAEKQFRSVTATLTFPESFFTTPFPRQRLEHDCRVFINSLLSQAELPTLPLPEIEKKSGSSKKSDPNATPTSGKRENLLWAHEMKAMIYKALNRHYTEDSLWLDSIGGRTVLKLGAHAIPYELDRDETSSLNRLFLYRDNVQKIKRSVFYVPSLTGEQKGLTQRALDRLWDAKLIPEDVPVLITERTYLTPQQLEGYIVLPHSFHSDMPLNPGEIIDDETKKSAAQSDDSSSASTASKLPKLNAEQYFSLYLPTIIQQRSRIRDTIVVTEQTSQEIVETLKLANLVIKCGMLEAKGALLRISKALKRLSTLDNANYDFSAQASSEAEPAYEDEDEDAFIADLEFGTNRIEMEPKISKNAKKSAQNDSTDESTGSNDIISADKLLRNITMHIVATGTSAEFDADRDVFIVPASISTDGFLNALQEYRPMLEIRQKLNPHALEHAEQYWKLLQLLQKLIGVKDIVLDGATVKNKIVQVHAARTIKRHAAELKAMNLRDIVLVLGDRFGVEPKRKYLYVPPEFEMTDLQAFLDQTASGLVQMRPYQ